MELAADGPLITMTPTGGKTGVRNSSFSIELRQANGARLGWLPIDLQEIWMA